MGGYQRLESGRVTPVDGFGSRKIEEPLPVDILETLRDPKKEDFERILAKVSEKDVRKVFEKPVTEDVVSGVCLVLLLLLFHTHKLPLYTNVLIHLMLTTGAWV